MNYICCQVVFFFLICDEIIQFSLLYQKGRLYVGVNHLFVSIAILFLFFGFFSLSRLFYFLKSNTHHHSHAAANFCPLPCHCFIGQMVEFMDLFKCITLVLNCLLFFAIYSVTLQVMINSCFCFHCLPCLIVLSVFLLNLSSIQCHLHRFLMLHPSTINGSLVPLESSWCTG